MKEQDPRAKLYTFLDGLGEEHKEEAEVIKAEYKTWTEELIHNKTEAGAANKELDAKIQTLTEEKTALEGKISTLSDATAQNESPRIIELEKTVKAMEERAKAAEDSALKVAADKERGDLFNAVTKQTNLRDEFAGMLFDKEITAGNILKQDGAIGGLVDGVFKPAEEYLAVVEEQYKPYLKVSAGGKNGNYTTGDPQTIAPVSIGEQRAAELKKQGGSMPISR